MEQNVKYQPGDTFTEAINGEFVTQYINAHGIKVRQRCSTCKFGIVKGGTTKDPLVVQCSVSDGNVIMKCSDLCRVWEPNKTAENAGKADGVCKRPEYLRWLANNIGELLSNYEKAFPEAAYRIKMPLSDYIHNIFEQTTGLSIYMS